MFTADLLNAVRERFCHIDRCPITGPRVFFENAGGALTLKSVLEASNTFAAIPDNQGRDNPASRHLQAVIDQCKRETLSFLGTDSGLVFVGESGTEVLFRLVRNAMIAAPAGGRVLGSSLEHPATASARALWAAQTGRENITIAHDPATGTIDAGAYRDAVTADTRVATIIHGSPLTGMAADLVSIVAEIRKVSAQCLIIVDGVQHAAHGRIGLGETDIDGYAISPYKVFSRHGYGIGWVSERMAELPHEQLAGAAARQWELGTRDTGAYATFSEVIRYLAWLGGQADPSADGQEACLAAAADAIHRQEKALIARMIDGDAGLPGLRALNRVKIIGGADNPKREGLVSLVVHDMPAAEVVAALNERGVRTHTRKADHFSSNVLVPLGLQSCVRVSICHYNSPAEIDQFLRAMHEIAG
ncbi:MAG: aminotransferase class V-fold PLP-dependent enzyme [Burkholderiaceae bacterium]